MYLRPIQRACYIAAVPRYDKPAEGSYRRIDLEGATVVLRAREAGGAERVERQSYEGPLRARWEYDRQIAQAIADGFRLAGPVPTGAQARHPALEAAIGKDPEGVDAYLVYADWLQDRGDPRGELISVQHAIAEHRRHGRTQHEQLFSGRALQLERAELLLLHRHRERFFGPALAQVHSVATQRYLSDLFELRWHCGFLAGAALPRSPARFGLERPLWPELLHGDSARFIRELALDWCDAREVAGAGPLPTVRRVEVVLDAWWRPEEEQQTTRVDAGYLSLEDILGPAVQRAGQVIERLQTLLRPEVLPGLEDLALQRCPFGRALCEALLGAPILRQLRRLDLSRGSLVDADLELLAERRRAWQHLQRLDLSRNRLSPAGRRQAGRLDPSVIAERR